MSVYMAVYMQFCKGEIGRVRGTRVQAEVTPGRSAQSFGKGVWDARWGADGRQNGQQFG